MEIAKVKTNTSLTARMSHWALLRIAVIAAVLLVTMIVIPRVFALFIPNQRSPFVVATNLLLAAAMVCSYGGAVRLLERRSATEMSFRTIDFIGGSVIGISLISAVYLVLWLPGCAVFAAGTGVSGLGVALVGTFVAALMEELLFRGVLFRISEEAFGTTAAVLLSAAIFGLLHSLNRGATMMSVVAIALEAGILLALAYATTRNLWLAVGIHLGWNFAEGNLYGAAVSGGEPLRSFARVALRGPEILTGGAFGPEASVVSVGICLIAAAVLLALVVRKREWRPAAMRLTLP